MYLYIFGSFCRGEIDKYSDIDLLVIKEKDENIDSFDLDKYSIYNRKRIEELWTEGNPFAWHLFLEAKLIFSTDRSNLLIEMGKPNKYSNLIEDLNKFYKLFNDSYTSLLRTNLSRDFDLSMIFLAIRNFASCYSLGFLSIPNFSRNSALTLYSNPLEISKECFYILENSRISSTRGIGSNVTLNQYDTVLKEVHEIRSWFELLMNKVIKK